MGSYAPWLCHCGCGAFRLPEYHSVSGLRFCVSCSFDRVVFRETKPQVIRYFIPVFFRSFFLGSLLISLSSCLVVQPAEVVAGGILKIDVAAVDVVGIGHTT